MMTLQDADGRGGEQHPAPPRSRRFGPALFRLLEIAFLAYVVYRSQESLADRDAIHRDNREIARALKAHDDWASKDRSILHAENERSKAERAENHRRIERLEAEVRALKGVVGAGAGGEGRH